MIKAIINVLLELVGTVVQVICYIPNEIIKATLPDFSDKITQVAEVFATVFSTITWGLGLLPDSVIVTLVFIVTIEIAKHTIFVSTHALIKLWNLFQRIKFW